MKVYIVTEGSYDDYHIVAVASTKERAERYKQAYGADESKQWLVDPAFEKLEQNKLRWHVILAREPRDWLAAYPDAYGPSVGYEFFNNEFVHVYYYAETKEDAVEHARQVRQHLLDTGEWTDERTTCDQGIHPLV